MTLEELCEEIGIHLDEATTNPKAKYHIWFEQNINGFPQLIKCDENDVEIDDAKGAIILR